MKKFKKLIIISQILLIFLFCIKVQNTALGATVSKGECVMEVTPHRQAPGPVAAPPPGSMQAGGP